MNDLQKLMAKNASRLEALRHERLNPPATPVWRAEVYWPARPPFSDEPYWGSPHEGEEETVREYFHFQLQGNQSARLMVKLPGEREFMTVDEFIFPDPAEKIAEAVTELYKPVRRE